MNAGHRLEKTIEILKYKYDISHTDSELKLYDKYVNSIISWNSFAKLVSVSSLDALYDHIADSLTLLPHLYPFRENKSVTYIDIGSGGGFPAIPLAINCPDLQIYLIEAHQKKCTFLEKIIRQLNLHNVTVVYDRFESIEIPGSRHIFTARAIEKPLDVSKHIVNTMGIDDVYLAQTEAAHGLNKKNVVIEEMVDGFSESDVRRGKAYVVSRYT